MYNLILIYLSNANESLCIQVKSVLKFRKFLFIFKNHSHYNYKEHVNNNNSGRRNLRTDFLKSTGKRVNFQKSSNKYNFNGKLSHRYFSWILTTVFCTPFFQGTFFRTFFREYSDSYLCFSHHKPSKQTVLFIFVN